jgi:hypothetical protein
MDYHIPDGKKEEDNLGCSDIHDANIVCNYRLSVLFQRI